MGYGSFIPNNVAGNYLAGQQAADQGQQALQLSRARDQQYQQNILNQQQAQDQQDQQRQQDAAKQLYLASQYALQVPQGQTKAFVEKNFPDLVAHAGPQWATATEDDVRSELQGVAAQTGAKVGIAPPQQAPETAPAAFTLKPGEKRFQGDKVVASNDALPPRHATAAAPGAGFNSDDGAIMAAIASRGTALPAGFRSKDQQIALIHGLRASNPDATPEEIANQIATGQIDFHSQGAGVKQFTSGKNGNTIRSLNVAVQHLDQLGQLAIALNNGDTPLFNRIAVAYKQQTGNAAPSNFEAAKKVVADEVVKAIVGSGGGVADRQEAAASINAASSPAQLAGVIQTYQGLMTGQLNGIRSQYQAATGRNDFESMLLPETRAKLETHDTQQAAPPQGQRLTPEQAAALPSGTQFVGMDGIPRVKH